MAATIIVFVLVVPFLRAPVLDLMWLPKSMTKKLTGKLYLSYSLLSLFDFAIDKVGNPVRECPAIFFRKLLGLFLEFRVDAEI